MQRPAPSDLAALTHSQPPVVCTRQASKSRCGQLRGLRVFTPPPSRLLSCSAPPATGLFQRPQASHGDVWPGEEDDSSEADEPSLRERLACSTGLLEDLKPECLAKLDAIVAEKGCQDVLLPALDQFASHAHKFRGGRRHVRRGQVAEQVPLSAFARSPPAELRFTAPAAHAEERSGGVAAPEHRLGGAKKACRQSEQWTPLLGPSAWHVDSPPCIGWRLQRARSSPGALCLGRRARPAVADNHRLP